MENLPSLIDLALMTPTACELTSEEIFFGAVKMLIEMVKSQLGDKLKEILLEITEGWKKGEKGWKIIQEQLDPPKKGINKS